MEGVLNKTLNEGNKQFPSGSSKFFTFEEGDNRLRIISPLQVFGRHYIQGEGYKNCFGKDKGCPLCNSENKVGPAYFCWVIDRKDGLIKEAKLSYTVLKSIDDTTAITEYNFTPAVDGIFPYDINIRMIEGKTKNEKRQYNILPAQPTELTEQEKVKVKELKHPMVMVEEMKLEAAEKAGVAIESDHSEISPEEAPTPEKAPELGFDKNEVKPF